MSKLSLTDAKTLEKLLFRLGFEAKRQKEVMYSIVIQMADIPLYHIKKEKILDDL